MFCGNFANFAKKLLRVRRSTRYRPQRTARGAASSILAAIAQSAKDLDGLFDAADTSRDGDVSREEFIATIALTSNSL